jgi:hypothetical protein
VVFEDADQVDVGEVEGVSASWVGLGDHDEEGGCHWDVVAGGVQWEVEVVASPPPSPASLKYHEP